MAETTMRPGVREVLSEQEQASLEAECKAMLVESVRWMKKHSPFQTEREVESFREGLRHGWYHRLEQDVNARIARKEG